MFRLSNKIRINEKHENFMILSYIEIFMQIMMNHGDKKLSALFGNPGYIIEKPIVGQKLKYTQRYDSE
jgi:hypothetical protein